MEWLTAEDKALSASIVEAETKRSKNQTNIMTIKEEIRNIESLPDEEDKDANLLHGLEKAIDQDRKSILESKLFP